MLNTKVREDSQRDGFEISSTKVVRAPGVKKTASTVKKRKTTRTLTKAQKERLALTKKRDIGAKAAAAKTPKSTRETVEQAGGPVRKGNAPKERSYDLTKSQRDGKAVLGKPQPKGTNPRQVPTGRKRSNSRDVAGEALKRFNKEKRILDMKERLKKDKSLSGTERQAKIRAETKKINAQAKGLRAQVEDKMRRRQEAQRNNVMPGKSDVSDQHLGKDWRNRLSNSRSRQMSEHMTRITSGKSVRTKGELLQSPKGSGVDRQDVNSPVTGADKAKRNAATRAKTGTGSVSVRGAGRRVDSSKLKEASIPKTGAKSRTILNRRKGYEPTTENVTPSRPRSKVGTTAKKDLRYEPRGIDPKTSNRAASKTSNVTKSSSKEQGPKESPTRAFKSTTPQPPASKVPSGRKGD